MTAASQIQTLLDAQREAFIAEGRVEASTRIDRLERARMMIARNQDASRVPRRLQHGLQ